MADTDSSAYVKFTKVYYRGKLGAYENVTCPTCHVTVRFANYQSHCEKIHGHHPRKCCVFCGGSYAWPKGQKHLHGSHLLECAKQFNNVHKRIPLVASTRSILAVAAPTPCPLNCFTFDTEVETPRHRTVPEWSARDRSLCGVDLMYRDLFPSEAPWCQLPPVPELLTQARTRREVYAVLNPASHHRRSGLRDAHPWLRRYVYFKKTLGFYHLTMRASCMKSFVEAMRGVEIVALPYWCVCNAGKREADLVRHHRHMLIVARDRQAYENALKTVAWGVVPVERNVKKYYNRKILNVSHFVSAITYVSRPRAKCDCERVCSPDSRNLFFDMTYVERSAQSHYYIRILVVPHANWWMFLFVPGNCFERRMQFLFGNRSLMNLKSKRLHLGRWQVSASDELKVRHCVVAFERDRWRIGSPVRGTLEEHVRRGGSFVYWLGDQIVDCFEMEQTPRDLLGWRNDCVRHRVNTLLNPGGLEDWVYLPIRIQRYVNDFEKFKKEYERKVAMEHGRVVQALKTRHATECAALDEKWAECLSEKERELERQSRKSGEREAQWATEIRTLKADLTRCREEGDPEDLVKALRMEKMKSEKARRALKTLNQKEKRRSKRKCLNCPSHCPGNDKRTKTK